MTVFADSSALVKLYVDEADHEVVRALPTMIVSQLARVEVPAALWRKHRMGELSASAAGVLRTAFEVDYFGEPETRPRFAAIAVIAEVLDSAARLCAAHGLRAYDAVQLASALVARTVAPECDTFAAFDTELRGAAAAEGFALSPA